LEKVPAWDRVALLSCGVILAVVGVFLGWRRKAKRDSELSKSQIVQLEQRVASAEKVGSLARTLGDYEVVDKLGAGAMGIVYKVKNPAGDIYAAKVPNEMDDRVLREAEVSASLKSPHIVKCFGMVEGEPNFLLLEYLDGETVHEWLGEHPRLTLEEIDSFVTQLLEALEVAHGQGVYHRDIKPENLFLAKENGEVRLKVMDFGLASSVNAARLTRTGEAMGTPIYASPEQLSGNPVDATTDLYSVGVFAFELATGLLPWNKTDPVALTIAKYKPLPKEPIEYRPELPVDWNELIVDLLKGDPKERPRSVEAVKARWAEGRTRIS
jgi:serine/threonine-protein kinase